ncbi:hypothetical protein [Streptomyces sp. NBC_00306]|uniref:hypothetical protein n=1 Tax=Streptomyces sp. NBC_00306 TaxID=2975708 RepID=UPI002E291366|nr:hypothetical protein [Streptomyces sp. NBC_00306]
MASKVDPLNVAVSLSVESVEVSGISDADGPDRPDLEMYGYASATPSKGELGVWQLGKCVVKYPSPTGLIWSSAGETGWSTDSCSPKNVVNDSPVNFAEAWLCAADNYGPPKPDFDCAREPYQNHWLAHLDSYEKVQFAYDFEDYDELSADDSVCEAKVSFAVTPRMLKPGASTTFNVSTPKEDDDDAACIVKFKIEYETAQPA